MLSLPVVCFFGSAFVLYLAFPNIVFLQGFSFLGWLFAIPFFFAIERIPRLWRASAGFVWGIVAYACLVHWMWPISFGGYVFLVLVLSVQPALFLLFLSVPDLPDKIKIFYYPSAWVVSEALRTMLMGGFTWSAAYSQAGTPSLIQAASWGGASAVAWIVIAFNTAAFLAIKNRFQKNRYWMIALALFLVNWVGGSLVMMVNDDAATFRISAVQPNISRDDKLSATLYQQNASRHFALTKKSVVAGYPDLIVWPETAFPDDILKDPIWRPRMEQVAQNFRAYFMVGSALLKDGKDLNSALLLSPEGVWKSIYTKRHLVPFSEYQPRDLLSRRLATRISPNGYDFAAGTSPGIFFLERNFKGEKRLETFGVAICSEEGYPDLFRELASKGAGFVTVMLNDGWFQSPQALMMHSLNSPFRAVETRRPVVRVANTGRTVAFDRYGRTVGVTTVALQQPSFGVFDIIPAQGTSFFVKFGDLFVVLYAGFVIITAGFFTIRRSFFS